MGEMFKYVHIGEQGIAIIGVNEDKLKEKIVIPDFIDDCPVTVIDDFAFSNLKNVQTIELGPNIQIIKDHAFQKSEIRRIVIGKSVRKVGYGAFLQCRKLEEVKWLSNAAIPSSAFKNCDNLRYIDLSYTSGIGQYAFENCGLKKIIIGANVKNIKSSAFYNCKQLASVSWLSNANIPDDAFGHCEKLKSFDFKNVKKIGKKAFRSSGLEKISIGDNVKKVDAYAFALCANLTSVKWKNPKISMATFMGCRHLKKFDLSHVKTIGRKAFLLCGLKRIKIGKNIEKISEDVFKDCICLKKAKWKSNIAMPADIFKFCLNLKVVKGGII